MMRKQEASILLHQYSEWLDSTGLMKRHDILTHDELVNEFLSQRDSLAHPRILDDAL